MSMNPDGTFSCDRCGTGVGNGGITEAVVVSDLDPAARGMIRNLHFCRDRTVAGEDGKPTEVPGCEHQLLSADNLRAYTDRQEASRA